MRMRIPPCRPHPLNHPLALEVQRSNCCFGRGMASVWRSIYRLRSVSRLRSSGPAALQAFRGYSRKPLSVDDIDEGLRLGDYPVLPWRSAQELKPRGWWDDQDRRDKETPLHEEDDALNMWMYDAVENNGKYTRWEALAQLCTMFAILGAVYYLSYLYDAPSRNPAVPRQFPYDNLYLERGGDPNVPPDQRSKLDKDNKVKACYGEYMS